MTPTERLQIANVRELLNNLLVQPMPVKNASRRNSTPHLATAKALRANIIEREKALPFLPSCNPGWRILLEIFISEGEGKPICVTDIGYTAELAGATTLRWLRLLESEALVTRHPDETDRRRCWLTLADEGRAAVVRVLSDLADRIAPTTAGGYLG